MGRVWRQQWNKRARLGVRVALWVWRLFLDQDHQQRCPSQDDLGNSTDTLLHNPAAALHRSLAVVRES